MPHPWPADVKVRCPVLVERNVELAHFEDLLNASAARRGGFSVLVGEAGVGKSRLVRELSASAVDRGMAVLVGRSAPGPTPVPYRPLTEAFVAPFRGAGPHDPALAMLRARLGRLLPDWRGEAPDLALEGRESPIILAEAIRDLLAVLGSTAGGVLVLEDLHWADAETLDIVGHLADSLSDLPVLMVATLRPEGSINERLARWRRDPAVDVVAVGRLSEAGVRAVVAQCLATEEPPAAVVQCVQANSEGNPFLVEELLAGLITDGRLIADERGWAVVGQLRPTVPYDFAASLQPRLGALDPAARLVLGAAALLGRHFEWELLAEVAGVEEDIVVEALRTAVAEQLIDAEDDEFRFRHALTREAMVRAVLPPERRHLAERAWPAIERAHPGLPGAWCELAADLADAAGRPDAAATYLVESAQRAARRGALVSAEDAARRARRLAWGLRRPGEGSSALLDAAERALVEILALAGKPDEALELGRTLLDRLASDRRSPVAVRLEVLVLLARAQIQGGRAARGAELLREAQRLTSPGGEADQCSLTALAALVALETGRREEAARLARIAAEAAAVARDAVVECEARLVLGRVLRNEANDEALTEFDRAARLASAHGLIAWELRAGQERALLRAFAFGDLRDLRQTRELGVQAGAVVTVAAMDLAAAELSLAFWEPGPAVEHARRCVEASRQYGLATGPVASLWAAGGHALTGDEAAMDAAVLDALALDPDDPRILGDLWGRVYAVRAMVLDDRERLRNDLDEMMRWVRVAPRTTSVFESRFLWAAIHALEDADGGIAARDELASATHLAGWPAYRRALALVDAVVAGRRGEPERAGTHVAKSDAIARGHADYTSARYLRIILAEAAIRDGWGEPMVWLRESEAYFATRGYERVARRCRRLLGDSGAPVPRPGRAREAVPEHLRAMGVTGREFDVLRLVADQLTNREIAERLYLSPKTVERHLTSLFARTGAGRRSELAALLAPHSG